MDVHKRIRPHQNLGILEDAVVGGTIIDTLAVEIHNSHKVAYGIKDLPTEVARISSGRGWRGFRWFRSRPGGRDLGLHFSLDDGLHRRAEALPGSLVDVIGRSRLHAVNRKILRRSVRHDHP